MRNGQRCRRKCENCEHCSTCHRYYKRSQKKRHLCFWVPNTAELPTALDKKKFWVFDFESMFVDGVEQVGAEEVKVQRHIVNFVAMRQLFTGLEMTMDTLDQFATQLQKMAAGKGEHVLIAHNMKGYDGRLVFDHFVKVVKHIPTDIIWNGTKIMQMKIYGKITFRDSLCHVANSLAAMPAIFGLDENKYKKGFFPYKFNVAENQDYIGRIPGIEYFEPRLMPPKKRKQFLQWYDTQRDVPYNFRRELEEYCLSDVRILAHSMERYMEDGFALNQGLNPMERSTIASYAMQIYKSLYAKPDVIAYLSPEAQQFARAAFAGGRTDVRRMLKHWSPADVKAGRYGVYQDVQSLYPTVQFYDPMPVGHPTITKYIDEQGKPTRAQPTVQELLTVFGFVKCDLLPTAYMHHPVVVEKKDGKLMADLYPKIGVCTLYLYNVNLMYI